MRNVDYYSHLSPLNIVMLLLHAQYSVFSIQMAGLRTAFSIQRSQYNVLYLKS